MAQYYDIFTGTQKSNSNTTLTFTIAAWLASSPGAAATIQMERACKLRYGKPAGYGYGDPIVPSMMDLTFIDPDGSLKTYLEAANGALDIKLTFTRTGFSWTGYAAPGTIRSTLFPDIETRRVSVTFGDLLNTIQTAVVTLDTNGKTLHDLFKEYVYDKVTALNLYYVLCWLPDNWGDLGAVGNLVNELKLYFSDLGISPLAQIEALLRDFDARIFQATTSSHWRITQRLGIGAAINTSTNFLSEYNGTSVADPASNLAADVETVSDEDMRVAGALFTTGRLVTRREVNFLMDVDQTEWDLMRGGTFEDWISASVPVFGTVTAGSVAQGGTARTGSSSLRINAPSATNFIEWGLCYVTANEPVYFNLEFYGRAVTTLTNVAYRLKLVPINPNESTYYSQTGGTWQSSFDIYGISGNFGTGVWDQEQVTIDPPPVTGLITLQIRSTNNDVFIDDLKVLLEDADGNVAGELLSSWFAITDTGVEAAGPVDSDERTYGEYSSSVEHLVITSGGSPTEYLVNEWVDEASAKHAVLAVLGARAMIENTGGGVTGFTAYFRDRLIPPERRVSYGAVNYAFGEGTELDFIEESTRGNWRKMTRAL